MTGYRSALRVGVLGVNFKTATLSLREAIAKGAQSLAGEKSLFFPHPTLLLSTCNRTEIYFSATDLVAAQSDLLSLLRHHITLPFEHHLYSYFGIDCFAHLCKVAAGLDSAIYSETEIQHQVKTAYAHATQFLTLPPPPLHYLFQKSLHIAKEIRNLEKPNETPSLFGTLWQIAEKTLGDLAQKRILLVGNSNIHRGFASFLEHKGITPLFCTRKPEHIHKTPACNHEELQRWNHYDLISCASTSDEFLIRGSGKPGQLLFDLSVPRNIDPAIAQGGAHLYNIDQLTRTQASMNGRFLETLDELVWNKVVNATQRYLNKTERSLFACH